MTPLKELGCYGIVNGYVVALDRGAGRLAEVTDAELDALDQRTNGPDYHQAAIYAERLRRRREADRRDPLAALARGVQTVMLSQPLADMIVYWSNQWPGDRATLVIDGGLMRRGSIGIRACIDAYDLVYVAEDGGPVVWAVTISAFSPAGKVVRAAFKAGRIGDCAGVLSALAAA